MTPFDGDMFGMEMDGEEIDKYVESLPISIFMRLHHENPQNKVYQKCLEQEIDNTSNEFIASLGLEQIVGLEVIFTILEHAINAMGIDEHDDKLMRIRMMRKIFDAIHEKVDKK